MMSEKVVVTVVGSSVAAGMKVDLGWAERLAEELGSQVKVVNVADCGSNTQKSIARFPDVVPQTKPDAVIISLSLNNEGLFKDAAFAAHQFKEGILELVRMTKALGALPFIASVYPNNRYTSAQYQCVKSVFEAMPIWAGCTVIDFLSPLDDGKGHWKPGTFADANHPNSYGHLLMLQSVLPVLKDLLHLSESQLNKAVCRCQELAAIEYTAQLPAVVVGKSDDGNDSEEGEMTEKITAAFKDHLQYHDNCQPSCDKCLLTRATLAMFPDFRTVMPQAIRIKRFARAFSKAAMALDPGSVQANDRCGEAMNAKRVIKLLKNWRKGNGFCSHIAKGCACGALRVWHTAADMPTAPNG